MTDKWKHTFTAVIINKQLMAEYTKHYDGQLSLTGNNC